MKDSPTVEDVFLYLIVLGLLGMVTWFLFSANRSIEERLPELLPSAPATVTGSAYLSAQMELSSMRYRQAAFALYSKSVRRNAGFLVGAVMTLLGGLFVIRRIESATDVAGEGGGWSASLKTSSPGIALSFFGTVVLAITLLAKEPVTVNDLGIAPDRGTVSMPRSGESDSDVDAALRALDFSGDSGGDR